MSRYRLKQQCILVPSNFKIQNLDSLLWPPQPTVIYGATASTNGGPMNILRPPLVATLTLFFLSIACGNNNPSPPPFQKASALCSNFVVDQQFLVHWKSGAITLEMANDTETFKNHFLKSHSAQIALVEPNYHIPANQLELSDQSTCKDKQPDNWGIQNTNISQVWQRGAKGQGIVVAIIDSGIDFYHPQLKDNLFMNTGEMGMDDNGLDKTHNGVDDDNNGYIDDINGYDFLTSSPYPIDNFGHGTHIAGIIAAKHSEDSHSTSQVQGVAPKAMILPLKFIEGNNGGDSFTAIKAIDYAVLMGAHIVNASWGGPLCSMALRNRIDDLAHQNILFVTAAGNNSQNLDRSPFYPASHNLPTQITVGALERSGNLAHFSNYGDNSVHIFAPGQDIVSTIPIHFGLATACSDGTSMAAPFIAGAAAALWSYEPSFLATDIRDSILKSVSTDSRYRNSTQGRLDLSNALDQLENPP